MKKFNSKVDAWIFLVLSFPIFISLYSIIGGDYTGYFVLIGFIIFAVLLFKTTIYSIDENNLIVKSLFIVNQKIEISTIRKIEKSNSILSSPALSLDRIVVKFNKYDEIYLSPKLKELFVEELLKVNPTIEINI